MSTQLTTQLKGLQQEKIERTGDGIRKQTTSILFGNNAKQFTMQQIHEISLVAFNELIILNNQFQRFSELFQQDSISYDREIHDPKDNDLLDKQIDQFLQKLAGYFAYPAAVKSLEFLLRRFRIDLHHKSQLITYFLPYHEIQSYQLLLQTLNPEDLDVNAFPCSRSQLSNYFLKQNSLNFGKQISTAKIMKQQSLVIHQKFICVLALEIYGKIQNSQNLTEFVRKSFDYVFDELKLDNNNDVTSWLLSVSVLFSKQPIQEKFANSLVYRILNLQNISLVTIIKSIIIIVKNQELPLNLELSEAILMKLLELNLAEIINIDLLLTRTVQTLLSHQLTVKSINLNSVLLRKIYEKSISEKAELPNFAISLTRQLLFFAENQPQIKLFLQTIEITNPLAFATGFSGFAQSGGALGSVSDIIQNAALVILQQKTGEFSLAQAIQHQDQTIRFSAYNSILQIIEKEDLSTQKSLLRVILCNLPLESEFNVILKQLEICNLVKDAEILAEQKSIEAIVQTFRRIVKTPSPFMLETSNALVSLISGAQSSDYQQIKNYVSLLNVLTNGTDAVNLTKFVHDNIQFSLFPFENENDFMECVKQQFFSSNILLVVLIVWIQGRENLINGQIIEQINRYGLFKEIFIGQLHNIMDDNVIMRIIPQLKGEVLLQYLKNVYDLHGFLKLFKIIEQNNSVSSQSVYSDILKYILVSIKEDQDVVLVFFLYMFSTTNQVQEIILQLQTCQFSAIKSLASNSITEIVQIMPELLPRLNNQEPIIINAFCSFIFSKLNDFKDDQENATVLIDFLTFLVCETTTDNFKEIAQLYFEKILNNHNYHDIGLYEIAYHNLCLIDDQIKQELPISLQQLNLCITIIIQVNNQQFQEIPYVMWILSAPSEFSEIIQNNKELLILTQAPKLTYVVNTLLLQAPISCKLEQTIIQSNPIAFIQILLLHNGIIEDIYELISLIITVLENSSDNEITINYCIKLLIKYQVSEQIELSIDQANIIFQHIQQCNINQMLSLANFLDLSGMLTFIEFTMKSNDFDTIFLRNLLSLLTEKFSQNEFIQIIIFIVNNIPRQVEYIKEIDIIIPEILSVLILILSKESRNFNFVKEIAQEMESSTIYGSISVVLGYLFDIVPVMELLVEENDQYLPKSLLDAAMGEDDKIIKNAIEYAEIMLKYVQTEQNEVQTFFSQSLSVSPIEFLLQIVLLVPEGLENILIQLNHQITEMTVLSKIIREVYENNKDILVIQKAFMILNLSVQSKDDVDVFYEVFIDIKDIINQFNIEHCVITFIVSILEKSTIANTKMIEIAEFFIQTYSSVLDSTDLELVDLVLYGLTFLPGILKVKLVPFLQSLVEKLITLKTIQQLQSMILELTQQLIQYAIKYSTFLLAKYFTILIEFGPDQLTENSPVYGEFNFVPEPEQTDEYRAKIANLEVLQLICQQIQLQVPFRVFSAFLKQFLPQILLQPASITQFCYLLFFSLKMYNNSTKSVTEICSLFTAIMALGDYRLNSVLASVVSFYVSALTPNELSEFLAEMLNFGTQDADTSSVPLFEAKTAALSRPNFANLVPLLQLFAGVATTKSNQFYAFVAGAIRDLTAQLLNATAEPSDLIPQFDSTVSAFQTPFYVFTTRFGADTPQSAQRNLGYAFLRFMAELFHSAPYVLDEFVVLSVVECAVAMRQPGEAERFELEAYAKLVRLQRSQVNFEATLCAIARSLAETGNFAVLEVVAREAGELFAGAAADVAELVNEAAESVVGEAAARRVVYAIEEGTKRTFRSFL
ncbi:hypothetical protein SS50377_27338 [Spironucleus salmonicida]|uniref:HEAT repeat-containing protein 1 n=1 Tax=Spironucleus salmonicida TaxID=348837 RepID=V6LI23_9EUKA|nr:hypothetical protein SS50377_27338 [Spironucleus salmonicida]|eukprot:EST43361.1 hypothetical protein SS50377_17040 [Spironucleus salmonicida]